MTTGATDVYANSINNLGHILGYYHIGDFNDYAVFHDGLVDPLLSAPTEPLSFIGFKSLNLHDQTLGLYNPSLGPFRLTTLLADPKTKVMNDLGQIPGYNDTFGEGLNDAGDVVGYVGVSSSGKYRTAAFLYKDGTLVLLPNFPGAVGDLSANRTGSFAKSINSHGDIVGMAVGPLGPTPAIWRHGVPSALPNHPGSPYIPMLINDSGQIVASYDSGDTRYVYFLSDGVWNTIASLPDKSDMSAQALNNQGWIVGDAFSPNGGGTRPFLWRNGRTIDLNRFLPVSSGWILDNSAGINDNGQIVCQGRANGIETSFVLTPAPALIPHTLSVSPGRVIVGGPDVTLTIQGTDFDDESVVLLNGAPQSSARYVSATQMLVTVPSASLAQAQFITVQVNTPAPGGGLSNPQYLNVATKRPTLNAITPARIDPGSSSTPITLTGLDFDPRAFVIFDSVSGSYAPVVVSSTTLRLILPASITTIPGEYYLRVVNPLGNNSSKPQKIIIGKTAPVIGLLSPNRIPVGIPSLSLYVHGTGIVAGSKVSFSNGPLVTPTSIQTNRLVVSVPAAVLARRGAYQVRIVNPIADGGYSEPTTFEVAARPVLTAVTPNSIKAALDAVTVTLIGGNFEAGSLVTISDKYTVTPTLISSNKLIIVLPSAVNSTAGSYFARVVNPGYANSSSPLRFSVTPAAN